MDKPETGLTFAARAAALAPTDMYALATLSRLQGASGQHHEALRTAELAIAADPEHEWPHRLRGWALWMLDRREAATDAMAEAVRLDPVEVYALSRLAWFASLVGRGEEAVVAGSRAVELAPSNGMAWFGLGWGAWAVKDWNLAEEALLKARDLNPSNSDAHNNLGALYTKLGRVTEALACFDRALELDARSAYAYRNAGYCLRVLGRWNEADAIVERDILNRMHNADAAIRTLGSSAAHTDRARALYDFGRLQEAHDELEEALRLAQTRDDTFRPLRRMASVKLFLGDDDAAKQVAERLLAEYSDDVSALSVTTWISWLADDTDLARRASVTAAKSGLSPAGVSTCLAEAALATGDFTAATQQLEHSIALNFTYGNCCAHAELGAAYYFTGETEKAAAAVLEASRARPSCETLVAMRDRLAIPVEALLPAEAAARIRPAGG